MVVLLDFIKTTCCTNRLLLFAPFSFWLWRFHLQFCLQRHKEDLGVGGGDGAQHQKDGGRRQNRRHYRQGMLLFWFQRSWSIASASYIHRRDVCLQTFLGDFQKEQEKFVQEKKARKSGKISDSGIFVWALFMMPSEVMWPYLLNIFLRDVLDKQVQL